VASLRWIADGIEDAKRAGGVELERYWRPGFTGGPAVRATPVVGLHASAIEITEDPEPDEA
jgi:hypothetical protein